MTELYPVYKIEIEGIHQLYEDIFKKWCGENCKDSFMITRRQYSKFNYEKNSITITFETEEDTVAFKLRWL